MDGMEDSMSQSLISLAEDSSSIQDMDLMNYLTHGEGSCTLVNEVEDLATSSASATSTAPPVSDRNGNLSLSMTSAGSDSANPPLASAPNSPVTGEITSMVSAGCNRNNPSETSSAAFSSDTSDTPSMMSAGFDSTEPPVTSTTSGSDTGDKMSMTAAGSNNSISMTVAGSSSADRVLLSTSSGSDGSSNPIESMMPADSAKNSDAPIVTGRQTRSKTASVSKLCSETMHDKEKSRRSLTDKKNVVADTLLPIVLLHDIRSHNEPKDDSAKKSLDVPSSDNSDEPGVLDRHSDEEDHLCNSRTTSNSQRKVNKQGRKLVTLRRKSTEAGKDQSKSKTSVTSVRILRVNRSSGSNLSDDLERAVEEHKRRNAESAKESRLKNKIYVENLEQEVEGDWKKIDELESYVNSLEVERKELLKEIHNLKSVLFSESTLALLLKYIPNVSYATLPSSLSRKRSANVDSCSAYPAKKPFGKSTGSGVCLHVDSGSVSLEACHHCAEMAQGDVGTV